MEAISLEATGWEALAAMVTHDSPESQEIDFSAP
jgi:hypothetical protein